ncbi:MAG: methyltransferase domain-containing protein [Rikenellaceae bacterium]
MLKSLPDVVAISIKIGIFVSVMTQETFDKLCSAELLNAIEANVERSAERIALDKKIVEPAIVATQVKYLQRAASKLPSYFAARAIMVPLSYEQASSEEVAATKELEGESLLDLTCGLGVDALHFSRRFKRVVAIERNEILAQVTRENFRRMGVSNIEVVCASAEEYLASCNERFDWIYVDPDRRSASGKKLVRLDECSPNILALQSDIDRVSGGRLMVKNSPLFDVDEAFRLFSPARVEVVSLGDECKEVLVSSHECDLLVARAVGRVTLSVARGDIDHDFCTSAFDGAQYQYLIIPDVALQKSRLVAHALGPVADVWSNNGFAFARSVPQDVMGRCFEIDKIVEYSPKQLKKELAGCGIEILKRDFPYSTSQITQQLKIKEGGARRVAFTRVADRNIVIFLK